MKNKTAGNHGSRVIELRDGVGLDWGQIVKQLAREGVTPGKGKKWLPQHIARMYQSAKAEQKKAPKSNKDKSKGDRSKNLQARSLSESPAEKRRGPGRPKGRVFFSGDGLTEEEQTAKIKAATQSFFETLSKLGVEPRGIQVSYSSLVRKTSTIGIGADIA